MSNKFLVSTRSFFNARRFFVTSSANLGNELQKAKPFTDIPNVSAFTLISRSLPGGRYHNISLKDMHISFRKEFGDIVRFPSMLGRPSIVFTYHAEDFEKVVQIICLSYQQNYRYPYKGLPK